MTNRTPDAEHAYRRLLEAVRRARDAQSGKLILVGVHSGGAWIAERLWADLGLDTPLGFLSSAFHRDDYGQGKRLTGPSKTTDLGFEIADADIVLVDDILFTGRTVRAVLNELFDYGRPRRVRLAVLIDRGGRELPIQADFCGAVHEIPAQCSFEFTRNDDGSFSLGLE
ncbi:MAG: bifunctional pyr operon transcriptional regulator/uracil phosphoribosyltransferase PyrR [Burkholderiaceae bacterium]